MRFVIGYQVGVAVGAAAGVHGYMAWASLVIAGLLAATLSRPDRTFETVASGRSARDD